MSNSCTKRTFFFCASVCWCVYITAAVLPKACDIVERDILENLNAILWHKIFWQTWIMEKEPQQLLHLVLCSVAQHIIAPYHSRDFTRGWPNTSSSSSPPSSCLVSSARCAWSSGCKTPGRLIQFYVAPISDDIFRSVSSIYDRSVELGRNKTSRRTLHFRDHCWGTSRPMNWKIIYVCMQYWGVIYLLCITKMCFLVSTLYHKPYKKSLEE